MKLIIVLIMALVAAGVEAAPAVQLAISDCAPAPPPTPVCPPNIPIYQLGQPVLFWVSAVDGSGQRATNYVGTIIFSSSDASALLPAPHTFTAADNSVFRTAITFNTPSSIVGFISGTNRQDITAADTANHLAGTAAFLLSGGPVSPVPTLDAVWLAALMVVLAFAGFISLLDYGLVYWELGELQCLL